MHHVRGRKAEHGWNANGEPQLTDQSFLDDMCDLLMLQRNDSDDENDDRDVWARRKNHRTNYLRMMTIFNTIFDIFLLEFAYFC